jgi:thiol-disulfide isomerase/thioredoxin
MRSDLKTNILRIAICAALLLAFSTIHFAQVEAAGSDAGRQSSGGNVNLNVTKVDDVTVKDVLTPNGRPLVVNFWATWCEPCREEFPDLIKIDADYKGRIDVRIISLDDPVEISRDVPKFLKDMGSTMTPYLLRTEDESKVIGAISDTWQGGLPFTVVYDANGKVIHARQGKIRAPVVRAALDQLLSPADKVAVTELVKVLNGMNEEAAFFYRNNWMALREEAVKRGKIDSFEIQFAEPGGEYDIALITRYKNELQYKLSESNFEVLLREMRPEGPLLVNTANPPEFRKSLSVTVSRSITSSQ